MTIRHLKSSAAIAALMGGALALSACGNGGFLGTGIGASNNNTASTSSATTNEARVSPGNTDRMMDRNTYGNSVLYSDGSIRHRDGTVYYGDGLVQYPDGTIASVPLRQGRPPNPTPGQGPVYQSGGNSSPAAPTKYSSWRYSDGTIVTPDGTIYYGDGRVRYPDGQTQTLEQRPGTANPAPGQGPAGRTSNNRVRG